MVKTIDVYGSNEAKVEPKIYNRKIRPHEVVWLRENEYKRGHTVRVWAVQRR